MKHDEVWTEFMIEFGLDLFRIFLILAAIVFIVAVVNHHSLKMSDYQKIALFAIFILSIIGGTCRYILILKRYQNIS